jgi:hypothetical protein
MRKDLLSGDFGFAHVKGRGGNWSYITPFSL